MVDSQSIEFGALGVELGFVYEAGALIPDGTDTPPEDPLAQQYFLTTRPGHRLPHAWLGSFKDARSTHDLVGTKGGWALITDDDGQAWVAAAERLSAKYGVPTNTAQIGQSPDLKDRDGQWEQVKQLKNGGGCPSSSRQFCGVAGETWNGWYW
jgi:2,4-dichlorophenol 6-monooxygenase